MGQFESTPAAKTAIQLVVNLDDRTFDQTIGYLKKRAESLKMNVSKWDLYMAMKISQTDIKRILQPISSEEDPTSVSVHRLAVLLLLLRCQLPPEQRIRKILDTVCFQLSVGQILQNEVEYVIDLGKTVVNGCSSSPIENLLNLQTLVYSKLYQKENTTAAIDIISSELASVTEVLDTINSLEIFNFSHALEKVQEMKDGGKTPKSGLVSLTDQEGVRTPKVQIKLTQNISPFKQEIKDDKVSLKSTMISKVFKQINTQVGGQGLIWQTQEQRTLYQKYKVPEMPTRSYNDDLKQTFFQFRKEYSPYPLELIAQVSDESFSVKQENQMVYGQNLLVSTTTARVFREKFALKSSTDLNNSHNMQSQKLVLQLGDSPETKLELSMNFKEFYRSHLSQVQYELKMSKNKSITFLARRGTKRQLEAKKYKTLGELQTLRRVLAQVMQKKHTIDLNQELEKKIASSIEQQKKAPDEKQEKVEVGEKPPESPQPQQDNLFTALQVEFEVLRSCDITRQKVIQFMELKKNKANSVRTKSFWQGAQQTIQYALQFPFFAEFKYLKDFDLYVKSKINDLDTSYCSVLNDWFQIKQSFDKHNVQIGKLKGFQFLVEAELMDELTWFQAINQRLLTLEVRSHNIEVSLVRHLQTQIEKKRAQHLFFLNSGKKSTYKCVTKSFSYEHVNEFLAICLLQYRMLELVYLTCQEAGSSMIVNSVPAESQQFVADIIQMQRMNELESKRSTFDDFREELLFIAEEERLNSEAPKVPHIVPLDQIKIERSLQDSVKTVMRSFYSQFRVQDNLANQFDDFVNTNLAYATFDLNGTMSFQTLDIENSGQLIFNLVESTNATKYNIEFISWLASKSCSLRDTYFQTQVEKLKSDQSRAHKQVHQFLQQTLQQSKEDTYVQVYFVEQRPKIFGQFMKSLRSSNKSNLLNNLQSVVLSLPLEYSLINNYWVIQSLKVYLSSLERTERFSQVSARKCGLLLRKRMPMLEHPKVINLGSKSTSRGNLQNPSLSDVNLPSNGSVYTDHNVQDNQMSAEEKENIDFQYQFLLCKGLDVVEDTFKQKVFGDVQDMIESTLQQVQFENAAIATVLQSKEGLHEMNQVKNTISKLIQALSPIKTLVDNYKQTRNAHLDQLKKQAVFGVYRGAVKYLECLTYQPVQELQEISEDQDGEENNTINRETSLHLLLDYIRHVFGKYSQSIGEIAAKIEPREFPNAPSFGLPYGMGGTGEGGNTLSISVKQRGYLGGYNAIEKASATKDSKIKTKKTIQKKKKTKLKPHQQAELDLQSHLVQKHQLVQMLILAENFDSVEQWFEWCSAEMDRRQVYAGKLESAINYLNANSRLPKAGAYRRIQEDELGCRIVQDVIVGALVDPVYAFKPHHIKTGQKGPTPAEFSLDGNGGEATLKQSSTDQLSEQQVSANYLLQFLNIMVKIDSKLTCKQILRNDRLFTFIHKLETDVSHLHSKLRIQNNLAKGFGNWINVFEIQKTPKEQYLNQYRVIYKSIMRDYLERVCKTDEDLARYEFFQILCKSTGDLLQPELSKVDFYMSMANVAEQDRLDFQTAAVKIKKQFYQQLRTLEEMNTLEEIRKGAQGHFGLCHNQDMRLEHEIASLVLVIKMYFFKQ